MTITIFSGGLFLDKHSKTSQSIPPAAALTAITSFNSSSLGSFTDIFEVLEFPKLFVEFQCFSNLEVNETENVSLMSR